MEARQDGAAPLPADLLPANPLVHQRLDTHSPPRAPRPAQNTRGATNGGVLATSSSSPARSCEANYDRTPSTDAETIERYSQLINLDARSLNRVRKDTASPSCETASNNRQASTRARKRWDKVTMVARSAVAFSRDVKLLRTMVGGVGDPSLTMEQMEAKLLDEAYSRQRGVIMPDSSFKLFWDVAQVILLLYVALLIPYRIGFSVAAAVLSSSWWFDLFVDLYFIADVILNFYFAYEDEHEQKIIADLRTIRRAYLRSWFLVDVVSVLPISYAHQVFGEASSNASNGNTKLLKMLRMVRLAKLLRLAKLQRLVKKYSAEVRGLAASVKLSCTFGAALLLAHVIACGWYFLGDFYDGTGWVSIKFPSNSTGCPPSSFDTCADMVCEPGVSKAVQYLNTLWWTISILIGSEMFSDIRPHTDVEVIFTLGLQVLGAIVFGVVIGTVGTLLMSSKLLEEKVDRQLAELREFLYEKKIPKSLRKRIREYMEHLYRAKTGYDVKEVLQNLPPKLAGELLDSMYRDTIVRVPLFRELEEGAVRDICLAMKPLSVMHGEYIYKENHLAREMYVVEQGQVQLSRYGLVIGVMHKSSFFGESALLPGRRVRDRSAYALMDSSLALLTKMDCDRIAREYPDMIRAFEHVAAKKTRMEAIRMNQLLQQAATELNVDMHSSTMRYLLNVLGDLAADQTAEKVEEKAVVIIQSHCRGWLARKRALTQTAIAKGILNTRPSALSLEENDAHTLVKDSFKKQDVMSTLNALSKTMKVTDTKIGTESIRSESIDSKMLRHFPSETKKSWFKRVRRAKSCRVFDGVPQTQVDEETINRVATNMMHEIMGIREGPQRIPASEPVVPKPLDLDGDGRIDATGHDTTGDGHVDTGIIHERTGLKQIRCTNNPTVDAVATSPGLCELRLGAIESKLEQVLQTQETLLQIMARDQDQHL